MSGEKSEFWKKLAYAEGKFLTGLLGGTGAGS